MRIALFTYATKPRGSVVHTLELAEALHGQGNEVCIYALDKDGSGFGRSLSCETRFVPANPAPPETDRLIAQRIQELVEYRLRFPESFDIYHAQDCISANALGMLRQQGQIPHFIRTVHHIEEYRSPYLRDCQARSIREADQCLCVSRTWQTALQEQYQIQASRVINGVNLQRFSPVLDGTEADLKQRWGLQGTPIYLTIGGIEPRKNSIALLEAFAQVLQDFPNAQLMIAGGATLFDYQPYRKQFFHRAEELGITAPSLILPGVISDAELPTLYRCADGFVFPSVKEGWGLVVLEAIASGLPVVTADQPPFTEFLSHHQACLVDPSNPRAIAEGMRTIAQPEMAHRLVAASQAVLADYTWAESAQLHLQHYRELLGRMESASRQA